MILEPNYQPEPPSNQNYDLLDCLDEPLTKEEHEILDKHLNEVYPDPEFTVEIPIGDPFIVWYLDKKSPGADIWVSYNHYRYTTRDGALDKLLSLKGSKTLYRVREVTYMPIKEEIIE